MDSMAAIRVTFFQECEEQLASLEAGLLTMEEGDHSADTVNAVFRAVHSIKGGAGAFKLTGLVNFAHVFETALDKVRAGQLKPDADVMKLMLRSADVLSDLVRDARDGQLSDEGPHVSVAEEIDALLARNSGEAEDDGGFDIDFAPIMVSFDALPEAPLENRFEVRLNPHRSLYEKANEPLALLRELGSLGTLELACDCSGLPPIDVLDPLQSYLQWTAIVTTEKGEQDIREVFEFVEGDCDLAVALVPPPAPVAEILPEAETPASLPVEEPPQAAEPPKVQTAALASTPPSAPAPAAAATAAAQPTIRVDLDRVDRLINLVGELVINQAMLAQRVHLSGHGDTGVTTSLDELEHLTRDLQESVMAIRAQPVKPLFQRMSRIVREVAEATGKMVRLRTEGEATEVDKTVLELLADPLTHMIRNAVDHGLETPEARVAKGKTPEGTVRLSAAHRSGRVVIEVADDGAGINRPKVLESAIRKGLVAPDAQLSDAEIDNLLFLPGFSTASAVSNISGRGVGMDVVKKSIQALGGRIATQSRANEGSTFTMSLPLTLAVLDGIIVSVAGQTFVIPLTAIIETLKPEPGWLHPLGDGTFVMQVRGKFVPLIDVGVELGVKPHGDNPPSGVAILVESENGSRSALLVDDIQDQRQVVIKSLETNYNRVPGVAAATILGDGRVAMILDVDSLIGIRPPDGMIGDPYEKSKPLALAS